MRAASAAALVALAACQDGGDPIGLERCQPCGRTAECRAPLRCRAGLCEGPDGMGACAAGGQAPGGEGADDGPAVGGEGEGEGDGPGEPGPVTCDGPGEPHAGSLRDGAECEDLAAIAGPEGHPAGDPAGAPGAGSGGGRGFLPHEGGHDGVGQSEEQALCQLVRRVSEEAQGAPEPPAVTIWPRTGSYVDRLGVRVCIRDGNGLGDLDCASLSLTLDGRDIAPDTLWFRHRPDVVCGQVLADAGASRWVSPEGDEAAVAASIADRGGLVGQGAARYTRAPRPPVRFTDVAGPAGLGHIYYRGNTHDGGVAWIDFDDDDFPDLYLTNGAGRENHLLRNKGDGTFADVTEGTPLGHRAWESSAAIFADVDNDGDDDLYVTGEHPQMALAAEEGGFEGNPVPGHRSALFVNHGGGRCWTDGTEAAGLLDLNADGDKFRTETGAFADYDRDGCVDLFLVHRRLGGEDPAYDGDRLYRSNCDGTFTDATARAGLDDRLRDGLGVLFEDLDGDLWPDLYIVNTAGGGRRLTPDAAGRMADEQGDDMLWRNRGDGTFEDVTAAAGVGTHAFAGMGVAAADFDRDGDIDLHITDITEALSLGNPLYRSRVAEDGRLAFDEVSFELGDVPMSGDYGWGNVFADFDNDGWPDLFYAGPTTRWLYMNDGAGGFHAVVGPQGGPGSDGEEHGIPDILEGRGVAAADYDRDGDVDLVVLQENPRGEFVRPQLLRNDTPRSGDRRWLEVRLRPHPGGRTNGTAIGARVEVRPEASDRDPDAGPVLLRQVTGGHSAFSQSEKVLHFGLGAWDRVGLVTVRWPSGAVQNLCDVEAGRLVTVWEPDLP